MGNKVVSRKEWLTARLELLGAEKELTRRSDELATDAGDVNRSRTTPSCCNDKKERHDD